MTQPYSSYSDDDIRELIADETPMRRAYELGLQDGRKLAEAEIERLKAALEEADWDR